jgi:hypothetical protein
MLAAAAAADAARTLRRLSDRDPSDMIFLLFTAESRAG